MIVASLLGTVQSRTASALMLARLSGLLLKAGQNSARQFVEGSGHNAATTITRGFISAISKGSSHQPCAQSVWKRLFERQFGNFRSLSTGESKAGQDMSGATHRILQDRVKMQMKKMQVAAEQQAEAAPSVGSKIASALFDAVALTIGGAVIFAGYYTVAYPSVSDLDKMVDRAERSLELAAAGDKSAPQFTSSDAEEAVEPSSFPPLTRAWCYCMERYLRARVGFEQYMRSYQDPTYHKLLPDMAPELRGRIKTLVLDLDDLLVHKEWTRQSGWKIYKRSGVTDFLMEMAAYYEIVLFTDGVATYVDPIVNKIDPHRAIMYRLYRPETQYHEGRHVRDLSKLNRDLSQILFISANPEAYEFQPENTLKLRKWTGDHTDTTLLDLVPMLQLISTRGVHDVRDVVKSYDGEEDVAKAFKARMTQIQSQQQTHKSRGFLGNLGRH